MNDKKSYLFTSDHEWINIDGNVATIGITDFAQSELGDIIFVELPGIGDSFQSKEVFGTIEAVKTVADLFMPLTGEILEINSNIEDNPEIINKNAFTSGWIVKIEIKNLNEKDMLLSYEQYKALINV